MAFILSGLVLGLAGSLGHCTGMCGGVSLLLTRWGVMGGPRSATTWLTHGGRVLTYTLLGALAGALGGLFRSALPDIRLIQGAVAVLAGVVLLYAFLALLGLVPSVERWAGPLARAWGRGFSSLSRRKALAPRGPGRLPTALAVGMGWGLLPCGLVLTGLVLSLATGSWLLGGAVMLTFGLATLPVLLTVGTLGGRGLAVPLLRRATAGLVLLAGAQMLLRGAGAWGLVPHVRAGQVMLW